MSKLKIDKSLKLLVRLQNSIPIYGIVLKIGTDQPIWLVRPRISPQVDLVLPKKWNLEASEKLMNKPILFDTV